MFEDARHDRLFLFLLKMSEGDTLKQTWFLENEINTKKSCYRKNTESKMIERIGSFTFIRLKFFVYYCICDPNLKTGDPILFEITTKGDEIDKLKYKTERQD